MTYWLTLVSLWEPPHRVMGSETLFLRCCIEKTVSDISTQPHSDSRSTSLGGLKIEQILTKYQDLYGWSISIQISNFLILPSNWNYKSVQKHVINIVLEGKTREGFRTPAQSHPSTTSISNAYFDKINNFEMDGSSWAIGAVLLQQIRCLSSSNCLRIPHPN